MSDDGRRANEDRGGRVYVYENENLYKNDTASVQQNKIIEDNINMMIIQDILEFDND